jgi:hypothetical protein
MEPIKDALAKIMSEWQAKRHDHNDHEFWLKKILTTKEFRHIKLTYFKAGVLNATVDSSSWLYYFSLKKEDLVQRLREHDPAIKNIRFYIGEIV